MKRSKEVGVHLYVCPTSLKIHGLRPDDVIPECDSGMGAAGYTSLGLEDDVAVFCY